LDNALATQCKLDVVLLVMKLSIQRVIAAVVMGVSLGVYRYNMQLTWVRRGKDAFIADEMRAWDVYATYLHPLAFKMATGVILSALVFGSYELITLVLLRLLPPPPTAQ